MEASGVPTSQRELLALHNFADRVASGTESDSWLSVLPRDASI